MAGGPSFSAAALFSISESSFGGAGAVWANSSGLTGWGIAVAPFNGFPGVYAVVGDGAGVFATTPVTIPPGWLIYAFLQHTPDPARTTLWVNGMRVASVDSACVASALAPTVGTADSAAPSAALPGLKVHGVAYDNDAGWDPVEAFLQATRTADLAIPQGEEGFEEGDLADFTNRFSVRFGATVPGQYTFEGPDEQEAIFPAPAAIWTPQAGPISLTRVGSDLFTSANTRMEFATPVVAPPPVIII
jgi:hypothetical protein